MGTNAVAQDDTSENVTLDPGDSTSVEFTNTVPDDVDISQDWLHVVTSEDDEVEQPVDIARSATQTVDVPANGSVTADFTLAPENGSISGTVTASDTSDPVANITVAAEDSDGTVYNATTGDNGTYTIDAPVGTYSVNVADTPAGYEAQRSRDVIFVTRGRDFDSWVLMV